MKIIDQYIMEVKANLKAVSVTYTSIPAKKTRK